MLAVLEFLKAHPCVDCGESDETILEFDHQGEKNFLIKKGLKHKKWDEVLAEMALCEIRCPNCHRKRTYHTHPNFGNRLESTS